MLQTTFRDTITLGSVMVGVLVALGGLAVFFYGVRWKSAYLVAEANAEAWHSTADRLEEELKHLRDEVRALRSRISELEGLPDVSSVLEAILAHDNRQDGLWDVHNDQANARADKIVEAIRSLKTNGGAA